MADPEAGASAAEVDVVEARADALTMAPLGAAFLMLADQAGLDAETTADPVTSLHVAAHALTATSIWRQDHGTVVAGVLANAARLRPLALAILRQPAAAWWFAPLDRGRQLITEFAEWTLATPVLAPPDRPPTGWERYAQKPDWGILTSTDVTGTGISSLLVGCSETAGDLGPLSLPTPRHRVLVSADARVFQVDGPLAWRRLCLSYPVAGNHEIAPVGHDFPTSGDNGQIVPDFAAAARDWDAVHLTLGGLLTAVQVRLDGPEGWTWLHGWDAEHTFWLRWAFDGIEAMPDVSAELEAPAALSSMGWLPGDPATGTLIAPSAWWVDQVVTRQE